MNWMCYIGMLWAGSGRKGIAMRAIVSALIIFGCFGIAPVHADEAKKIDIIDFLVDANDLVGKTVTVTGCKFKGADTTSIMCSAGSRGNIAIDSNSLTDREDLRRALKSCFDLIANVPGCEGSVTGIVKKTYSVRLTKAKINWAQ